MISVKTVSLVIVVILVTVIEFRQVSATPGVMCGSTQECGVPGVEECVFNTNVNPPCQKGICTCVATHVPDSQNLCQKLITLKINETCNNYTQERYPANAFCGKNGTVYCMPEYVPNGNSCIRPVSSSSSSVTPVYGTLPEGAPCQKQSDCMGDMQCGDGARYICNCRAVYMRFDEAKRRCVRREYGDPCTRDTQCNVYARPFGNWLTDFEGYNYREGRCVGGRCICSNNSVSLVRTSYVDVNNTLITKNICVVAGASTAKRGDRCTLNPIGFGASTQTVLCSEPFNVCYQCPEEYTYDNYGIQAGSCRAVTTQYSTDLQRPSQAIQNIDPSFYGRIPAGYDMNGYSITVATTTTAWPTEPVYLKKVGDMCATNADCGWSEICSISTNVDSPCTRGICQCKACFAVDAITKLCSPLMLRTLNDICYYSDTELLPKNTFCDRGYVHCKPGYSPSFLGSDCIRQRGVGSYGDECSSDAQCFDGLKCNMWYFMCDCPHVYQLWDNTTQSCINREFNDPCSDESECRVPGSEWNGFTYAGGTCIRGHCVCAQYNKQTTVGFVDPATGNFKTKIICVNEAVQTEVPKSGRCTVDPIKYGQMQQTRICTTTNMCYQCPEDYQRYFTSSTTPDPGTTLGPMNTGEGLCRAVSRSPPQPNCEAALTTTTVLPNFGI